MKTDIQIAQEATLKPITEIAGQLGSQPGIVKVTILNL